MSASLAWQLYVYSAASIEVFYLSIALFSFLQWLKFSIFSSLALLFAVIFRHSILAIMLTLLCVLISHVRVLILGPSRLDFPKGDEWLRYMSHCLPDSRLFQFPSAAFTKQVDLSAHDCLALIVYALTYCALYLSLAIWGFKKRQLNTCA